MALCRNYCIIIYAIFLPLLLLYLLHTDFTTDGITRLLKVVLQKKNFKHIANAKHETFDKLPNAKSSANRLTTNESTERVERSSEISFRITMQREFGGLADLLNQKSAYYGVIYQDTYGIPRSPFGVTNSYSVEKTDWKLLFPELFSSIKLYKAEDRWKKYGVTFTISLNSPMKEFYFVGEKFKTTFQAWDARGQPKTYGGDYYRARLKSAHGWKADGITCNVIDHGSGFYTVEAPLVIAGKLRLEIILVQPLEGISAILNLTLGLQTWSFGYNGKLKDGKWTKCDLVQTNYLLKYLELCDYSNPRNKETWFCLKRKSERCGTLKTIYSRGGGTRSLMTTSFDKICEKYGCHESMKTSTTIAVFQGKREEASVYKDLPLCQQSFKHHDSLYSVSGHFVGIRWMSLQCRSMLKTWTQLQACLKDTVIYFLGDSTLRQFFYLAAKQLQLTVDGPDHIHYWHVPQVAYNHKRNVTFYFRAHGPPLRNPGPPSTRPYISDSIDTIRSGGNGLYVIFTIGSHFLDYDPSLYIRRLKGIKASMIKHHKEYPETRFVVKGPNVVEFKFEWVLKRSEVILREMFKGIENVVYLNLWDMTNMWPLKDIHPMGDLLRIQALLMFSFVCG